MRLERKEIIVANPAATFIAECDERAVVVGPLPGRMLFHSFETPVTKTGGVDWSMIQRRIQTKWTSMDVNKRNRYYGAKGLYATTRYPKFPATKEPKK